MGPPIVRKPSRSQPERLGIFAQLEDFKPKKSDLRRIAIIRAVVDCIAKDGIHRLSAEAIGTRTKMRRSHICYYFPNQESMIRSAVEFVVATGQEVTVAYLATETEPRARLLAYLKGTYGWFERFPEHGAVMSLLHYYGAVDDGFRALNLRVKEAGEERITELLMAGATRSQKRAEARSLAVDLRAHLAGSVLTTLASEPAPNLSRARRGAERLFLEVADRFWSAR